MPDRKNRIHVDIISTLPALRALALCYTDDPDYAEQLVADTLVGALGNSGSFHPNEDPFSWLLAQLRRLAHTTSVLPPDMLDSGAAPSANALSNLSIDIREVLVMHDAHDTRTDRSRVRLFHRPGN